MKNDKRTYSTTPEDFCYIEKNIPCQAACPASTNIPAYIRAVHEKKCESSYLINRESNVLPGVLGRICSRPCEKKCRHGELGLGDAVNICHIKRSASDFRQGDETKTGPKKTGNKKKIAVVGAGPAGLAAAHDLLLSGFEVALFDALEKPGGMLQYGIPEFRLPRDIIKGEIDYLVSLGATITCNKEIGKDLPLSSLLKKYDSVLLSSGCMNPIVLNIPGEELSGVYSGIDFMLNVSAGSPPLLGKKILIIGAGFTAFDCARTALRNGAEEVSICMRLTEQDLTITEDEIVAAKFEGITLMGLVVSRRIVGETQVEGLEFCRTKVSRDENGKRKDFSVIEGSEFILPADGIIIATGQRPRPIKGPESKNERGLFDANRETGKAALKGLYLAGDYLTGPSTVIQSVASGRKAARQITADLTNTDINKKIVALTPHKNTDRERLWDFIPRQKMSTMSSVEQ